MPNEREQSPPNTPACILNLKEVRHRVGVARATIYRWVKSGDFPAPVRIGKNRIGWLDYVLEDWIRNLPNKNP